MAASPEIQALIDSLHASPRPEGWAQSVADQYNAALASIETPGLEARPEQIASMKNDVLQEILRQNVDQDILPDVMQLFDNGPGADFAETLEQRASAWPEDLRVYTEEEYEATGPRGNVYAEQVNSETAAQIAAAAREGNAGSTLQMLLLLNQQARDNAAAPVQIAPGSDVPGSMTPQGQTLFDYVQDKIYLANSDSDRVHQAFDPDGADGGQYREGVLITLTPEGMRDMIRTEIARDIENGTFPIDGLNVTDAGRIADTLYEQAFSQAERTGVDVGGSVEGSVLNYAFRTSPADLSAAIDGLFLGDTPVLTSTAEVGWNEHQFAEEYATVMNTWGAGLTAEHLREHFTDLTEGRWDYTVRPAEFIEPTLDIPPNMRTAFLDSVEEAYNRSRLADPNDPDSLRSNFDPDVFGEEMERRYGMIDAEHVVSPMNRDGLDYGQEIPVQLGAETENGFQVVNEAGEVMFEIDLSEGFSVYAASTFGDNIVMDNMRGVQTKEDLRELLGEEGFSIRAVSPLDEGLDGTDTGISGYYIHAPGAGNSFHIGFDAIPENGVREEFKDVRNDGFDSRTEAPQAEVGRDFVIGNEQRPTVQQLGL